MEEDELVLSDVHLGRRSFESNAEPFSYEYSSGEMQITVTASRFLFKWPSDDQSAEAPAEPDEDGDMDVKRRSDHVPLFLMIEHSMASPLPLVGLQVWAGALLMCDYVLQNHQRISDKVILELGAGTGICSIVAAIFAKKVICTDYDHRVLRLCRRNVSKNDQLFQHCSHLLRPHNQSHAEPKRACVEVKELNWSLADPFAWDNSCVKIKEDDWKDVEIILAADVIYDNQLTDHLFGLLEKLFRQPPKKTVFISLERRLNFTLEKLDISCLAHDHFLRHLDDPRFGSARVRQIPTNFPKHFDYERNKYLELWEISS